MYQDWSYKSISTYCLRQCRTTLVNIFSDTLLLLFSGQCSGNLSLWLNCCGYCLVNKNNRILSAAKSGGEMDQRTLIIEIESLPWTISAVKHLGRGILLCLNMVCFWVSLWVFTSQSIGHFLEHSCPKTMNVFRNMEWQQDWAIEAGQAFTKNLYPWYTGPSVMSWHRKDK